MIRIDRTTSVKHCLERGFSTGDYRWNKPYLDLAIIDLRRNQDSIIYLKLHGSIDWWFRNSDGWFAPSSIDIRTSEVYVADFNGFIKKFDSNGNFITKWGSEDDGDGQFEYAADVDLDSSGNVYVADRDNTNADIFDAFRLAMKFYRFE